jgi:hypothetical protein
MENKRQFMKSDFANPVHRRSDQAKGVPYPSLQKSLPEGDYQLIDLPDPNPGLANKTDFFQIVKDQ